MGLPVIHLWQMIRELFENSEQLPKSPILTEISALYAPPARPGRAGKGTVWGK